MLRGRTRGTRNEIFALCCTVPDIVKLFEGDLRVMATDLTGARKSLVARASFGGSLHNHVRMHRVRNSFQRPQYR